MDKAGSGRNRIAALDPGKVTGWAILEVPFRVVAVGQVPGDDVLTVLRTWSPDEVVVEAFRLYPWRAKNLSWNDMPAAQVIGAIKAWCKDYGVPLVEQPASAMDFCHRKMMEALGGWRATRGKPHARDALRHAYYRSITKYARKEDVDYALGAVVS